MATGALQIRVDNKEDRKALAEYLATDAEAKYRLLSHKLEASEQNNQFLRERVAEAERRAREVQLLLQKSLSRAARSKSRDACRESVAIVRCIRKVARNKGAARRLMAALHPDRYDDDQVATYAQRVFVFVQGVRDAPVDTA